MSGASDDRFAAELRGFGPVGITAVLIVVAGTAISANIGAPLALTWVYLSGTPWREVGFVRPASWTRTVLAGVVIGFALKLLLKAVVMPLLGAPEINQAYHYLVGDRAAIPGFVLTLVVGAGFGEESLYRGYMFERLGKRLGTATPAKIFTVVATSLLFSAAHYPGQGFGGAEQALMTGLVLGTMFALTGRIALVMIVHAAYDLTAYWIIYHDMEVRVAHLFFR